ncbi:MAG: glycosyltransferase [Oscillospiraceae bacterium]|nr:glycosyltransferase [Oscillospiraceae bacterium]MDD7041463.1 glycosyltransferase [Oscillospiraceae bacterium]MDY2610812.1 glycosyltransferase [Oscillospiraceae bacterium]
MRIALFTETYLPHINGVVTHVKILRDGLLQQGHEVLVVTADYQTRHHYIKDGILHCPAIKSKRFYGYGVASPFSRRRLKLVQDFHPDIIHIHNEFGIGLSGIFAAKQLHVPLVYTLHTMYDDYLYYVAPRHLLRAAKKVSHDYFRLLGNAATELTGPSPKCQEYFQQIGVKKDVNVIPNAVELDDFSPDRISAENKAAFRRRYQIPDDVMIACFVGRLGHEKSVDVLLDYWARTITPEDKIMLCIIGGGPVQEELEQQAKDLGIGSMVVFTGAVPHDQMPPYYASCDVYVTASLSDTNSISMLEGMATGLPVLRRYDALNENVDQVRDGVNGYIFNSPEEMAAELRRVKNLSPEQLSILKASVIESVKRSGAEALANYTYNVYRKAMASASNPKEK